MISVVIPARDADAKILIFSMCEDVVFSSQALHGMLAHEDCSDALTEREFEVLRLLAAGHSHPAISKLLRLNYKTVANYQSSIRQKLGIENNVQLLRLAIDRGWVQPKP